MLLLISSERGQIYSFATPKLQPILVNENSKQLIEQCLNAPDPTALYGMPMDPSANVPPSTQQMPQQQMAQQQMPAGTMPAGTMPLSAPQMTPAQMAAYTQAVGTHAVYPGGTVVTLQPGQVHPGDPTLMAHPGVHPGQHPGVATTYMIGPDGTPIASMMPPPQ